MEAKKTITNDEVLLVTDDEVLKVDALGSLNGEKIYEPGVAYLKPPFFYTYRGLVKGNDMTIPGIYMDDHERYHLVEADSEKHPECLIGDRISTTDQADIIHVVMEKTDLGMNVQESSRLFRPVITGKDDILKRGIIQALLVKGIDIDQYKSRFSDKNALFNFKQVVKNEDSKLSILLFERGCNALNLKYTIIIEEKDPEQSIGTRLSDPIVVSSEDTY